MCLPGDFRSECKLNKRGHGGAPCQWLAQPDWHLTELTINRCQVKFSSSAGCPALCFMRSAPLLIFFFLFAPAHHFSFFAPAHHFSFCLCLALAKMKMHSRGVLSYRFLCAVEKSRDRFICLVVLEQERGRWGMVCNNVCGNNVSPNRQIPIKMSIRRSFAALRCQIKQNLIYTQTNF